MPTACPDNNNDSPITAQSTACLAAWETVDEEDIEKYQADHKFDLSTLFNFAPRDRKDSGSGFDDAGSLNTFANGFSQPTKTIGTSTDSNFPDQRGGGCQQGGGRRCQCATSQQHPQPHNWGVNVNTCVTIQPVVGGE